MNNIKLWPHVTIAVLGALILGMGVAYYVRQPTVSAESLPNAARIQRVDGEVALNNSSNNDEGNAQWIAATANQPFSVGDRIYTRNGSRASLAFSGRNFARLEPNTSLDAMSLTDSRTQLALRDGSAIFDVGYLAPGQLFEVGTPYGAVDLVQPGLYNIGFDRSGYPVVSVLSGLAQVVGLGGSGQISKGEMLTLLGATAAEVVLSRLDGRNAGYLVDDYYRYQYPTVYDGRYVSYDAYLNDPFYYDPYRRYASYQYVTYAIPGVNDLDYYGDWQDVSGYGYAWRPRVDAAWAPYQQGYWINDYPYGLTWVSTEPWGYAPYHYGRWAFVGNQWFWIPEAVNTTPLYSPALVAFVPLTQNEVGWVPLGPGDPYVARYYDDNWQPHYLTRGDVIATHLVNLAVPNAVTVVPVENFTRPIDPRVVVRVNPQMLAQVRPTLEPLMLTPLRNAVLHSAWGRGKIDLPPGIAKKPLNTPVVVSAAPFAPPFRRDLARELRVEPVPEKVKNQKLKFKDERNGGVAQQIDAARRQQMADVAAEAVGGNRDARRQARELEQQQRRQQFDLESAQRNAAQQARQLEQQQRRQQLDLEKAQRREAQQAQGEPVGHRMKQRVIEVPRPQMQRAQPEVPGAARVPLPVKHGQQRSEGAEKHERKQPPDQSQGQEGKGKGKGKP